MMRSVSVIDAFISVSKWVRSSSDQCCDHTMKSDDRWISLTECIFNSNVPLSRKLRIKKTGYLNPGLSRRPVIDRDENGRVGPGGYTLSSMSFFPRR